MKTVKLLFYPLAKSESDELMVNDDELLVKELHFNSKVSDDEIVNHLNTLSNVVYLVSYTIKVTE